jgi:hypothetical protein
MARRHHYRRRVANTYEIDVTTFLNLVDRRLQRHEP